MANSGLLTAGVEMQNEKIEDDFVQVKNLTKADGDLSQELKALFGVLERPELISNCSTALN
jgi:hypothetical protein